jgi:hypothetical protein
MSRSPGTGSPSHRNSSVRRFGRPDTPGAALVTDAQLLRGLEALCALDGRRFYDRNFYKLENCQSLTTTASGLGARGR